MSLPVCFSFSNWSFIKRFSFGSILSPFMSKLLYVMHHFGELILFFYYIIMIIIYHKFGESEFIKPVRIFFYMTVRLSRR